MQKDLRALLCGGLFYFGCNAATHAQTPRDNRPQRAANQLTASEKRAATDATPLALYTEAANYTQRQYDELNRQKAPFDPALQTKIFAEQRALATRHAAELAARPALTGLDYFYLGMLYRLADNQAAAANYLQRYLTGAVTDSSAGEEVRQARNNLYQALIEIKDFPAAASALAEYLKNYPGASVGALTYPLARALRLAGEYETALPHARAAYNDALEKSKALKDERQATALLLFAEELTRDYEALDRTAEILFTLNEIRAVGLKQNVPLLVTEASGRLADALIDARRKPEAVQILESAATELAARNAVATPESARTADYLQRKQQSIKLLGEYAPEVIAADWIGIPRVGKMEELRGRVVLLDFWATWCVPCIKSFPALRRWHEKYEAKGLTIIGVTKLYGSGGDKELNPQEELAYLRRFKEQYKLPYGFAVTAVNHTHQNYSANSLPTAVLIDRTGRIRYIYVGVSEYGEEAMRERIEKLLREKTQVAETH